MTPPLELDYIGLSPPPAAKASDDLRGTELRLGPPGSSSPDRGPTTLDLLPAAKAAGAKRGFADGAGPAAAKSPVMGGASGKGMEDAAAAAAASEKKKSAAAPPQPAAKAQVVGWPPVRSYRKNTMATSQVKNKEEAETKHCMGFLYVKVSMDGAPYLRKIDLKTYRNYKELSDALEKMFCGFPVDILGGKEYVLTYEDKDGDLMLVGDVPWEMFTDSCQRLRIMKGSDAIGLAPRAMEKSKNPN